MLDSSYGSNLDKFRPWVSLCFRFGSSVMIRVNTVLRLWVQSLLGLIIVSYKAYSLHYD